MKTLFQLLGLSKEAISIEPDAMPTVLAYHERLRRLDPLGEAYVEGECGPVNRCRLVIDAKRDGSRRFIGTGRQIVSV